MAISNVFALLYFAQPSICVQISIIRWVPCERFFRQFPSFQWYLCRRCVLHSTPIYILFVSLQNASKLKHQLQMAQNLWAQSGLAFNIRFKGSNGFDLLQYKINEHVEELNRMSERNECNVSLKQKIECVAPTAKLSKILDDVCVYVCR